MRACSDSSSRLRRSCSASASAALRLQAAGGFGGAVELGREEVQAHLGGVALLGHGGDLAAHRGEALLVPLDLGGELRDRALGLLLLAGERSGGGLLFLHAAQLGRERGGDLLQLLIGIVELRLGDPELLLGGGDFAAVTLAERGELLRALLIENDAALVIRDAGAEVVHHLARLLERLLHLLERGAVHGSLALLPLDFALGLRLARRAARRAPRRRRVRWLSRASHWRRALWVSMVRRSATQRLVAARLAGLTLERADLALHLFDDVLQAHEIRLGRLELAQRLLLLRLEAGDAGGFLEDGAAILGLRREDRVDLALLHDRVGGAADARIHEKLLDIAQPAGGAIELILRAAIAEDPAGDGDLVPVEPELLLAIGEGHRDLGHAERRAGIGAGEDDVGHLAAAQRLGGLLAEDPADGVEDVRFAAAVRADHAGHALVEIEDRLRGERLEAAELERFEVHGWRGKRAQSRETPAARARLYIVVGRNSEHYRRCFSGVQSTIGTKKEGARWGALVGKLDCGRREEPLRRRW